jgi:hypothetical protein
MLARTRNALNLLPLLGPYVTQVIVERDWLDMKWGVPLSPLPLYSNEKSGPLANDSTSKDPKLVVMSFVYFGYLWFSFLISRSACELIYWRIAFMCVYIHKFFSNLCMDLPILVWESILKKEYWLICSTHVRHAIAWLLRAMRFLRHEKSFQIGNGNWRGISNSNKTFSNKRYPARITFVEESNWLQEWERLYTIQPTSVESSFMIIFKFTLIF